MVHVEALNSERRASEVVSEVVALAHDCKVYLSIDYGFRDVPTALAGRALCIKHRTNIKNITNIKKQTKTLCCYVWLR